MMGAELAQFGHNYRDRAGVAHASAAHPKVIRGVQKFRTYQSTPPKGGVQRKRVETKKTNPMGYGFSKLSPKDKGTKPAKHDASNTMDNKPSEDPIDTLRKASTMEKISIKSKPKSAPTNENPNDDGGWESAGGETDHQLLH